MHYSVHELLKITPSFMSKRKSSLSLTFEFVDWDPEYLVKSIPELSGHLNEGRPLINFGVDAADVT